MALGRKTGGRQKGVGNKRLPLRELCEKWEADPFEFMAKAIAGKLECNVCRQRLVTRVRGSVHSREHFRDCQSCKGDGWEKLSPEFRGRMAEALASYLEPKMQSIAHTGADGGPIDHKMEVVFVEAENGKPKS